MGTHAFDWVVRKSEYVVQERWITVRADSCMMPNGRVIEPYYVLEYPTWVNVVALTAADEVVLVRQYRHGLRQTILGFPSGMVDPEDASPLAAASRELREETGYGSEHLVEIGCLAPNPATHTNVTYCYLATDTRQVAAPQPEDTEQMEVVLLPVQTVVEYAVRGQLPQSLHVGSLFLALHALGRLQLT
jgi:ADP-ribose pyrophosphatase